MDKNHLITISLICNLLLGNGRRGYDFQLHISFSLLLFYQFYGILFIQGDTCAHQLTTNRRQEALKIMNTTTKAVQSAFPHIPYFPSVGNNDLPGHYVMPGENDTWYSDLLNIWEEGILCKHCTDAPYPPTTAEALRQTFLYGGYYSVSIAGVKNNLCSFDNKCF